MSEFRRKQQDERKRLDKAKTKWHSEQVQRTWMHAWLHRQLTACCSNAVTAHSYLLPPPGIAVFCSRVPASQAGILARCVDVCAGHLPVHMHHLAVEACA
jgi:hypothetical protein